VVRLFAAWRAGAGTFGFGEFATINADQAKRLALLFILIVFVAAIPWLGTTLGIFLVMLASMWVLGMRAVGSMLAIAFATAAAVYLLFIALLQTRLPTGPIERLLAPLFGG
jgi:Tripartite tricarboxylate transporter TctB family